MRRRGVKLLVTVTVLVAVVAGVLAWATSDDSSQPPAAKVQVMRLLLLSPGRQIIGTYAKGSSVDELVKGANSVVILKVVEAGPIFNSRRTGDDMQSPPDPSYYSIAHLYKGQVEQWLKGSGPSTIWFAQNEGSIPDGRPQTKAAIEAARQNSGATIPQVGGRFLFFLDPPLQVPELGNITWYTGAMRMPYVFALTSDGTASVSLSQDDSVAQDLAETFPRGPEKALIDKIEKAVASQK
jgi:hypothetical protein